MIKKKTGEKFFFAAAAFVIISSLAVCSVAQYFGACREVRSDVLRLHIIADSNSRADQDVKLAVRDVLLQNGSGVFSGAVTASDAEKAIGERLYEIEDAANGVLEENGFSYKAKASVVYEYFDTREYDGFTLPAGKYTALKVVLGRGEGKNWWCVMFPPLCLPAASENEKDVCEVFSDGELRAVEPQNGYKVRFKIVELVEKAFERIEKMLEDKNKSSDPVPVS
ncbi:MAG: stage II sporulation protein R [Clostridia bacterium]|nr:stage II sporulation protein R [Clostridia bacterium]